MPADILQSVDQLHAAAAALDPARSERLQRLLDTCDMTREAIRVKDSERLRAEVAVLAELAAFGSAEVRIAAHHIVTILAQVSGIYCASIDVLYQQIGARVHGEFTVPAINVRAVAYETARGVFRAMRDDRVGAVIFELSRGEIGFTGQRPHEYAAVIQCAALAEGHTGPLFLQGDHFQISASRYAEDPAAEIGAIKSLIAEAVNAGFYNIDIDSSTLVDLSQPTVALQQKTNALLTAELATFTRQHEPDGVTISIGGEIGEVGEENSTVEEVEAYLTGVADALGPDHRMISKLSIQSGTRHGGNVLPDGSFGDMDVDFQLISALTDACRRHSGLAGSVQHGASMLSLPKIARLPGAGCIEVHLAAAFLNAVYDNLPDSLVRQADQWLKQNFSSHWRQDWSEAQFLHHARRFPIGPFKRRWWDAVSAHTAIRNAVRQKASAYFKALNVLDTRTLIEQAVTPLTVPWRAPQAVPRGRVDDEASIHDLAS